jgi:hypothetical protein
MMEPVVMAVPIFEVTFLKTLSSAMIKRMLFLTCGWLAMVAVSTTSLYAQRTLDNQYRPERPTISPYAGLLQVENGSIPNYFSLVRPRLEQRAFNQQLKETTRVQSLEIQTQGSVAVQKTAGTPTGNTAGFAQYSHYFPAAKPGSRKKSTP